MAGVKPPQDVFDAPDASVAGGRVNLTAGSILDLLAAKHWKDVFVSECKTGPTHGAEFRRMDAWAMRKSWTNPCCVAYEVKVSRSDFLKDQKWRRYLPYCNQLYFVCPRGVIQDGELSAEAGLLAVTANGRRLLTKRKAPFRDVEIPEGVFRYILMARVQVTREHQLRDRATHWRDWLAKKRENAELGWNVSQRIRELVEERITKVEHQNRALAKENSKLAEIKQLCDELGINPRSVWDAKRTLQQKLDDIRGGRLLRQIDEVSTALTKVQAMIDEPATGNERPRRGAKR